MKKSLFIFCLCLFFTACTSTPKNKLTTEKQDLSLKSVSFKNLPDWEKDNHDNALKTFLVSCSRILKKTPASSFGPDEWAGQYSDWQDVCKKAQNATSAKLFFEQNFKPYKVFSNRNDTGLFTGYYEASLKGSYTKHGPYQYPLYARPKDLIMVDLGAFREDFRGHRIAGRVINGELKPYETRKGLEQKNQGTPLVWVDSAIDSFFLHIQGSGRIILDDGSSIRVGYAGQNGHPYYAIGRELVKRNHLKKEDVSMQSIRTWLENHPEQADDIMHTNKSYVFFKILKNKEGPLGGEGLPLTADRSLAIDRSIIPYGLPVWLSTKEPAINRLMITQDTGGAIRGSVRGDIFFGYGKKAEEQAGKMKAQGAYYFLLPKSSKNDDK